MSPTMRPSGCAESSSRRIFSRASLPIAANMSAYRVTSTGAACFRVAILIFLEIRFQNTRNNEKASRPCFNGIRETFEGFAREHGFAVSLGGFGCQTNGLVLFHQARTLDYKRAARPLWG